MALAGSFNSGGPVCGSRVHTQSHRVVDDFDEGCAGNRTGCVRPRAGIRKVRGYSIARRGRRTNRLRSSTRARNPLEQQVATNARSRHEEASTRQHYALYGPGAVTNETSLTDCRSRRDGLAWSSWGETTSSDPPCAAPPDRGPRPDRDADDEFEPRERNACRGGHHVAHPISPALSRNFPWRGRINLTTRMMRA